MHVHVYFMYMRYFLYISKCYGFHKKQFFITQCLTDVFVRINKKIKLYAFANRKILSVHGCFELFFMETYYIMQIR